MTAVASRTDRLAAWLGWSLVLMVLVVIHLPRTLQVGFLPDDWAHLQRTATTEVAQWSFDPTQASPVMQLLYRAVSIHLIGPATWHLIGLFFHCLSLMLIWRITRKHFSISLAASLGVLLFSAINLPGLEALVWCSSLGYVICSTVILFALSLFLDQAVEKERPEWWFAPMLGGLQIVALLVWDWGVLLFPVLFVAAAFGQGNWRSNFKLLIPAAICWGSFLFLGQISGFGYGAFNRPVTMFRYIFLSPLVILIPGLSASAYASLPLLMATMACWVAMVILGSASKMSRLFFILFVAVQGPHFLFSFPQSQYFYLASVFFYLGLFGGMGSRGYRPVLWGSFLTLAAFHIYWAGVKTSAWKETYRQSEYVRAQIEKIVAQRPEESKAPVIVNLPDIAAQWNLNVERVSTEGALIERETLFERFPEREIYECIRHPDDSIELVLLSD